MIYATNTTRMATAVYSHNGITSVVEVVKKAGRSTYTFLISGKDFNRSCFDATEAWNELCQTLNTEVKTVTDRWLTHKFPEYKVYKEKAAKQRKEVREYKKLLQKNVEVCEKATFSWKRNNNRPQRDVFRGK